MSERTSCPKTTTNNLKDIIDWLKLGDAVCIHTTTDKAFYSVKQACDTDFKNIRILCVDVSFMPSLLNDGEWPWYIDQATAAKKRENDEEKLFVEQCKNVYHFKI